jgi:hypothetical protein
VCSSDLVKFFVVGFAVGDNKLSAFFKFFKKIAQCFDLCPIQNFKPQYRPKMRFPTPSDAPCNETISTPARNLYEVQVAMNIIGYCRIESLRVHAYDIQEPSVGDCRTVFPACTPISACDINPLTYTSESVNT